MSDRPPEAHTILDDAWGQVVGGMDWLKSVLFGEFSDHRTRSAMVADMLVSFVPGVVIVTSSRDAVAVILRLANHPEKREDLMEWVLLSACLIVIALPIAMAAGGLAAAGVGAVVGGIAGTELGAALRAVMLLLIKDAVELIRLMRFLQKFMTGNILLFLRSLKFAKYEKPVIEAVVKMTGKLVEIVKALRLHLESLRYFNSVKSTIIKLTEWERKFYAVQQDALKHMPRALAELDARLAKVLAQTAPKEAHAVSAGVEADKAAAAIPAVQRVRDTPGHVMARVEDEVLATGAAPKTSAKAEPRPNGSTKPKPAPKAKPKPKGPPKPPLKNKPDPVKPHTEGANTKKQVVAEASAEASSVKPVVTAAAKVNGSTFSDVNQTARIGANAQNETLIAGRVAAREAATGKVLPNGNMGTAHAEIGAIQQAFDAGATAGADMTLTVTGKAVCGHCIGDVAAMAKQSGLNSLTVIEEATGNTLFWEPGMRSLKRGP